MPSRTVERYTELLGQLVLARQPVADRQPAIDDVFEDRLGDVLVGRSAFQPRETDLPILAHVPVLIAAAANSRSRSIRR